MKKSSPPYSPAQLAQLATGAVTALGRPWKDPASARSRRITLNLTPDELMELRAAAAKRGITVSEALRMALGYLVATGKL